MHLIKKSQIYISFMLIIFMILFLSACEMGVEERGEIISFELLDQEDNNVQENVNIKSDNLEVISYVEEGKLKETNKFKPIISVTEGFSVFYENELHENQKSSYNFEDPVEFEIISDQDSSNVCTWTINLISEKMVLVEGGTTAPENGEISLDYDIFVGKYPVTFDEYDEFDDSPSDEGWGRGKRPVINVNWPGAVEYANWLSKQEGLTPAYEVNNDVPRGYILKDDPSKVEGYRLLETNEWEYVARGGVDGEPTKYAGSDNLDEVGWYENNSNDKTHPVGELQPNELGIYDLSGNVFEWLNTSSVNSPNTKNRLGSAPYNGSPEDCEVDDENKVKYTVSDSRIGFRLTRTK